MLHHHPYTEKLTHFTVIPIQHQQDAVPTAVQLTIVLILTRQKDNMMRKIFSIDDLGGSNFVVL